MSNITPVVFQVLSNLQFGSTLYKKDSFFQGDLAAFGYLVNDGVLRVVEGAETVEEAKEIVASELAKATTEGQTAVAPQDTWGPQPDKVVESPVTANAAAPTEEVKAVPTASATGKFNVIKEFEVTNKESKNFGIHAVGEVIEADIEAAKPLIDDGTLELIDESKNL